MLKEFYHRIDFQVPSSHGELLLFYLVHADMPEILEKVLYEHPHFLLLEDSKQCTVLDYLKKYEEERLVLLFENRIKEKHSVEFNDIEKKNYSSINTKEKLKFYIEHFI